MKVMTTLNANVVEKRIFSHEDDATLSCLASTGVNCDQERPSETQKSQQALRHCRDKENSLNVA